MYANLQCRICKCAVNKHLERLMKLVIVYIKSKVLPNLLVSRSFHVTAFFFPLMCIHQTSDMAHVTAWLG